jgi:hypothetical protein
VRRLLTDRALAAFIALFCMLVATSLVLSAVALNRVNDLTNRVTGSLCALRHDLEERVSNGEAFLREHPRGIPGIPAATLKQSIGGQVRTIRALSDLRCRS